MLQAYIQHLPELLRVTSENILPVEQAMLGARQQLSPAQAQLELDQYRQFGPEFARIGADVSREAALGQAASDAAVLGGPGREVVQRASELARIADPEYYQTRESAAAALQNLFAGLPDAGTGLEPTERAEIERVVARNNAARGNINPTAVGTVSEAMKFGQAGADRQAQKQAQIANAVGTAAGFLGPSQSRVDVFQQVTGRPSANFGEARYSGPVQQAGQQTFGMGQGLMNQTGQFQMQANQINANRRDFLDRFNQFNQATVGSVCCWIFLSAHGGELPWYVRYCRDHLGTEETRAGYRRMSAWLVPIMQRSRAARWLVRTIMTEPLAMYGGYLLAVPGCENGRVFRPIKRAWFAIWNRIGRINNI